MWSPTLEPHLSQGDLVRDVLIGEIVVQSPLLVQTNLRGNRHGWATTETFQANREGYVMCLAKARLHNVVVLSHSCDLDKQESKGKVQVAPIRQVSHMSANDLQSLPAIKEGRRASAFWLPNVTGLGDCSADLRLTTFIDRRLLEAARFASMDEGSRRLLRRQLVAFTARLDLDSDEAEPSQFSCFGCGGRLPLPDEADRGYRATCKACGALNEVTDMRRTVMVKGRRVLADQATGT